MFGMCTSQGVMSGTLHLKQFFPSACVILGERLGWRHILELSTCGRYLKLEDWMRSLRKEKRF